MGRDAEKVVRETKHMSPSWQRSSSSSNQFTGRKRHSVKWKA